MGEFNDQIDSLLHPQLEEEIELLETSLRSLVNRKRTLDQQMEKERMEEKTAEAMLQALQQQQEHLLKARQIHERLTTEMSQKLLKYEEQHSALLKGMEEDGFVVHAQHLLDEKRGHSNKPGNKYYEDNNVDDNDNEDDHVNEDDSRSRDENTESQFEASGETADEDNHDTTTISCSSFPQDSSIPAAAAAPLVDIHSEPVFIKSFFSGDVCYISNKSLHRNNIRCSVDGSLWPCLGGGSSSSSSSSAAVVVAKIMKVISTEILALDSKYGSGAHRAYFLRGTCLDLVSSAGMLEALPQQQQQQQQQQATENVNIDDNEDNPKNDDIIMTEALEADVTSARATEMTDTTTNDGTRQQDHDDNVDDGEVQDKSAIRIVDPKVVLCPYELGGVCADEFCPYQHLSASRPLLPPEMHPLPKLRLPQLPMSSSTSSSPVLTPPQAATDASNGFSATKNNKRAKIDLSITEVDATTTAVNIDTEPSVDFAEDGISVGTPLNDDDDNDRHDSSDGVAQNKRDEDKTEEEGITQDWDNEMDCISLPKVSDMEPSNTSSDEGDEEEEQEEKTFRKAFGRYSDESSSESEADEEDDTKQGEGVARFWWEEDDDSRISHTVPSPGTHPLSLPEWLHAIGGFRIIECPSPGKESPVGRKRARETVNPPTIQRKVIYRRTKPCSELEMVMFCGRVVDCVRVLIHGGRFDVAFGLNELALGLIFSCDAFQEPPESKTCFLPIHAVLYSMLLTKMAITGAFCNISNKGGEFFCLFAMQLCLALSSEFLHLYYLEMKDCIEQTMANDDPGGYERLPDQAIWANTQGTLRNFFFKKIRKRKKHIKGNWVATCWRNKELYVLGDWMCCFSVFEPADVDSSLVGKETFDDPSLNLPYHFERLMKTKERAKKFLVIIVSLSKLKICARQWAGAALSSSDPDNGMLEALVSKIMGISSTLAWCPGEEVQSTIWLIIASYCGYLSFVSTATSLSLILREKEQGKVATDEKKNALTFVHQKTEACISGIVTCFRKMCNHLRFLASGNATGEKHLVDLFLSPCQALCAAAYVGTRQYGKAQLFLENSILSGTKPSSTVSEGQGRNTRPSSTSISVYSELLWSQIVQLIATMPEHSQMENNSWQERCADTVSRISAFGVHLNHIRLLGDAHFRNGFGGKDKSVLQRACNRVALMLHAMVDRNVSSSHNNDEPMKRDEDHIILDDRRRDSSRSPQQFNHWIRYRLAGCKQRGSGRYREKNDLVSFPHECDRISEFPTSLLVIGDHISSFQAVHCKPLALPLTIGNWFPNLKDLDLSNCELVGLPDSLGEMKSLETLQVQFNNLRLLPNTIGNLQELRKLNVAHNVLVELPGSIRQCTKLQSILAQGNQLVKIPTADLTLELTQLYEFELEGNPLSSDDCWCFFIELEGA